MIHICNEAQNHNVMVVKENGKFNVYSKYYNLYDKPKITDPDWYLSLRIKDIKVCLYCGVKLS